MKTISNRGDARAYGMSIAFWCGFALLMGLQYQPFNPRNPSAWLVDLVIGVALRGFALALWTPPIFYLVGKYLKRSQCSSVESGSGALHSALHQHTVATLSPL